MLGTAKARWAFERDSAKALKRKSFGEIRSFFISNWYSVKNIETERERRKFLILWGLFLCCGEGKISIQ